MNSSDGWVMVKMDFESVLHRQCNHGDFEQWQPAADLVVNNKYIDKFRKIDGKICKCDADLSNVQNTL
jgi:hypothetical protein